MCQPRFDTFLRVLEGEEEKIRTDSGIADGIAGLSLSSDSNIPLSLRIKKSWETKTWLINYAARNSWAFDCIFWKFLDARYFGENEEGDYEARLGLLTVREIEAMEPFVKIKMEESRERTLV